MFVTYVLIKASDISFFDLFYVTFSNISLYFYINISICNIFYPSIFIVHMCRAGINRVLYVDVCNSDLKCSHFWTFCYLMQMLI